MISLFPVILTCLNFPGGPVVRTPLNHCRRLRFSPLSGSQDPACLKVRPKKMTKQKKKNLLKNFYVVKTFHIGIFCN